MDLTLQATRYMIVLQLGIIGLLSVNSFLTGGAPALFFIAGPVISLGFIALFYLGLRREYLWVAILFSLICTFDLFVAIGGGINLENSVNLVGAVLSFVALCGLAQWFKQRGENLSDSI